MTEPNAYGLTVGRHVLVPVTIDAHRPPVDRPAIVFEAGSESCAVEVFGLHPNHPERIRGVRSDPGWGEWKPIP